LQHSGPVAIRYPRGKGLGAVMDPEYQILPLGQAEIIKEGSDLQIFALGSMVGPALEAAAALESEGVSAGVVNCRFVKPLDNGLVDLAASSGRVLTVEENILQGGFGGAILERFNDAGLREVRVRRIGLPDKFIEHGPQDLLRVKYGLDAAGILGEARTLL
jgi:1-deoxy-D-xylulose-5-phosphate synthase